MRDSALHRALKPPPDQPAKSGKEDTMGTSDGSHGGHASGRSSRCIALVGPFLSGKTTLLEAILARTGGITRQGTDR